MGERSAGNPHAAFDAEGAGNVARSKLFGLPFHAAYAIATAIAGTPAKKMSNSSPSTIHTAVVESIAGSIIHDYPDINNSPKRRGLAVSA